MTTARARITQLLGGTALAVAIPALAAAPGVAAATGRQIECQHPVQTGEFVEDLHEVSRRTACRLALELQNGDTVRRGCDGSQPVLYTHSFDGWRLKIDDYVVLVTRRPSSFKTYGEDWPNDCF